MITDNQPINEPVGRLMSKIGKMSQELLQSRLSSLDIDRSFYPLNLETSLQRLRYGQATSLEVHQAQEYFVHSSTRLINFQYNLKIAEIKLKQLIAEL